MKKIIFIITSLLTINACFCQISNSAVDKLEKKVGFSVFFFQNTTKIVQNKVELDSLFNLFLKSSIEKNSFIEIKYSAKKSEYNFDKYIDLKRCQIIAEYFSTRFNFDISQFLIRMEKAEDSEMNKFVKSKSFIYLAPW